ncbi:type II toxin-antitoxin system antitoxin SocA domain-containing protein [Micromonosporaceae bacterium B7E4]
MAGVHDVAAALLERLGEMTAMKLEKLVYYCQCWHLARYESALFDEPIQAWRQGPVVPALYQRHRGRYTINSWSDGDPARLDALARSTVEWVAARYGRYSAIELSRMTHAELPWRVARDDLPDSAPSSNEIRRDIITVYYARQRADAETAVALATASAALEGVELDAEWQDRLRDVATGVISADELIAEAIARSDGA